MSPWDLVVWSAALAVGMALCWAATAFGLGLVKSVLERGHATPDTPDTPDIEG